MSSEGAHLHRRVMRAAPRSARQWPEAFVLDLVGRIYEAAGDASRWPDVITRLLDALGAAGGGLSYHDFDSNRGALSVSVRLDPAFVDSYQQYYSAIEPGIDTVKDLVRMAPIFGPREVLIPAREMVRSEFGADWLRPQRIFDNLTGAVLYEGSVVSGFDFYRSDSSDDYGPRECGLIYMLMPHLRRAMQLHQRIEGFARLQRAAMDVIEGHDLGVILLDADGHVVAANRVARAILADADGLGSHHRLVCAVHPGDNAALTAAVHGATETGAGIGTGHGGALSVSRPSGKRPYAVLVSPLRTEDERLARARTSAVLFVSDPETRPEPDALLLQRLYGLTPAEAQVCSLCAAGECVEDIANALSTSRETTRTHVKRVLQKTGTRRQAQLARLVLQGPVGGRRGHPAHTPSG